MSIMHYLAHTSVPLLSPDQNPLLRLFLKKTFYAQFCAGENSTEVHRTISSLRSIGFSGVILAYAREVVLSKTQTSSLAPCDGPEAEACIQNEIIPWQKGTLETVRMTSPGDYVALKFTGAGSQALWDLTKKTGPSEALRRAIDEICTLAHERGVELLFDAEYQSLQPGIDAWTMEYMERFNKDGKAVVYGTYQAYLKAVPRILGEHLAAARKGNFVLGVKLVRGAYLGSDPRHLIHDTKPDTDRHYDGIAKALCRRQYSSILPAAAGEEGKPFPDVNLVLAGHNITSVRKIRALRTEQKQKGEKQIECIYAQLQGMADEVSCEIVQARTAASELEASKAEMEKSAKVDVDIPKAYKYLVWGTTGECMKYLLRRAEENKDSLQRTREGRDEMGRELARRVRKLFGFA